MPALSPRAQSPQPSARNTPGMAPAARVAHQPVHQAQLIQCRPMQPSSSLPTQVLPPHAHGLASPLLRGSAASMVPVQVDVVRHASNGHIAANDKFSAQQHAQLVHEEQQHLAKQQSELDDLRRQKPHLSKLYDQEEELARQWDEIRRMREQQ